MDTSTTVRIIHYYDTQAHRIVCGAHGVEQRSTKHTRAVNCITCLNLLAGRASAANGEHHDPAAATIQ